MPALRHLFERLKQIKCVERVVLCTTVEAEDDPLVALADEAGVAWHRGAVEDVLCRMIGAIDGRAVDVVLRVTGDDILVDPDYADRAVAHHLRVGAEYSDLKQMPSGTEVEVFDANLLLDIRAAARDPAGTEYLTNYVVENRDQFRTTTVPVDERHTRGWRLTLDTPEDHEVIRALLEGMRAKGKELTYRLDDIVEFFAAHPEVLEINARTQQRAAPPEVNTDLDWTRLS